MISDIIQSAHDDNRLFIRSTLKNGMSYHAWPDENGDLGWSMPNDLNPGKWRSPQVEKADIYPHQGGMHAARLHALSYWIGPEIYLFETHKDATTVIVDDVISTDKGRLLKKLKTPNDFWFDFACSCLEKLLPFPDVYNYTNDFGSSATRGPLHWSVKDAFENAKKHYNFQSTLDIIQSWQAIGKTSLSTAERNRIWFHDMQSYAHQISLGREASYDLHNEAVSEALQAFGATRLFFDEKTGAYTTAQKILKHTAKAFEAAGREQQVLMVQNGYSIEDGLGPIFKNLPYLPHKAVIMSEYGRVAKRGLMLDVNRSLLRQLGLQSFDPLAHSSPTSSVHQIMEEKTEMLIALEKVELV